MKEQLNNTSVIEDECDKGQFGSQGICIAGAATFMANNYGRTDEATVFCETLSFLNMRSCLASLSGMKGIFVVP